MDKLVSSIGDLNDPRMESGDSIADRLSSRHSVFLMFLFSVVLTLKQHYVGEPITCWHPKHFTDSHEDYVNSLCWVNNTYFLPFNESIPKESEERKFIGYYQWTSLILCCQAIMFYIPRVVWMTFNKKSGIEITTITGASMECLNQHESEGRRKTMEYMIGHMGRFLGELNGKLNLSSGLKSFWWRAYGNYLAMLYLWVKILYVFNAVFQLILLDRMLGLRDHMHGINFLKKLFADDASGVESPLFPRVAMCDFKIRVLGNIQRYTVQCSLPINLFNEKIFIFVWFWLVFVASMTSFSFLVWLWRAVYMEQHTKYIKTRLVSLEKLGDATRAKIRDFVTNYLRRDGVFIIYLVGINSSDLVASELVVGLWQRYLRTKRPVFVADTNQTEVWNSDAQLPKLSEMDSLTEPEKDVESVPGFFSRLKERRRSSLRRQNPLDKPDGVIVKPSAPPEQAVSFEIDDDISEGNGVKPSNPKEKSISFDTVEEKPLINDKETNLDAHNTKPSSAESVYFDAK